MVYETGNTPALAVGAAVGGTTLVIVSEAPGMAVPQQQEPYAVTTLPSLPPQ